MAQSSTLRVESTPPTVDDALTLAQWGITVIPLDPGTKKPAIEGYAHEATTDPATLRRWWHKWPTANMGHVVSAQELVIDVDPRHNGLVGWQNLLAQHGPLPATWTVQTGRQDGGFQLHYAVPEGIILPACTSLAGKGVEALGQGHNVLMPPSLHPATGLPYTWAAEHAPFDFCVEAMAPNWLIDVVLATAKRKTRAPSAKVAKLPQSPQGYTASEIATPGSNKVLSDPEGGGLGTLFQAPAAQHSEHLRALFCDPDNVPALLDVCGLPSTLDVGSDTHCPFHADAHPSATLLGPEHGYRSYGLYCHASACKRYYSLVDIFYFRTSARILSLHTEIDSKGFTRDHKALYDLWLARMLDAAGLLHLATELGLPSVPHDAPEHVKVVFDVFLEVRRLRSATRTLDAPMPFSLRFIQDWVGSACDISFHYAKQGKRFIIQQAYILGMGKDEKGDTLWTLGGRGLRRARKAMPMFGPRAREQEIIADVATTEPVPVPPPTPACPDVLSHTTAEARLCAQCAQDRLLAVRASRGIVSDPHNPYGLARAPTFPQRQED